MSGDPLVCLRIVCTPSGDRAYASDPAGAIVAARQLLREARAAGAGDPRVSITVTAPVPLSQAEAASWTHCRSDLRRTDL